MASPRIARILFLTASGLYFAAALLDLFVPTRISHAGGPPLMSASLGSVFLIVGIALRRQLRSH